MALGKVGLEGIVVAERTEQLLRHRTSNSHKNELCRMGFIVGSLA
jgi:hypothetical protein